MERTAAYMVRTDERMERTDRAIERLEGVIERMEQEGARDREAATRDREEMKHEAAREREFDALYVGTRAVLLNETKATARPGYARAFVEFLESGQFARYVPEYRELPIVPVFSSLSIPADVVTYLTRRGIYAVAMGDEAVQVLNLQAVRSRRA